MAGMASAAIENCHNTGEISSLSKGIAYAGGMAGFLSSNITIKNCYNTGTINSGSYAGGVTGSSNSDNTIKNCGNTGNVSGNWTGGISGKYSGTIENCYNTGAIDSGIYAGGMVGELRGSVKNCRNAGGIDSKNTAGGMVGNLGYGTIENCYTAGNITASSTSDNYAGGMAGKIASGSTVSGSAILCGEISAKFTYMVGYFSASASDAKKISNIALTDIAGNPTDDTGDGARISADDAKKQATYEALGWDFENVWTIDEGNAYPRLIAFAEPQPGPPKPFTITAISGANGSMTPSGAVPVNEGDAQVFTITPAGGYKINDVIVDGNSVLDRLTGNSYTFENTAANHAIFVFFAPADGDGHRGGGKFLAPIEAPVSGSIPISTRAELEKIGADSESMGKSYHLSADIDLSDAEWTPLGYNPADESADIFYGTFDGQGHVIRGLTITGNYRYAGLFGYVGYVDGDSGAVKNVGFEGTNINVNAQSSTEAGSIAGRSAGGGIANCYNTGNITATAASSSAYAGGLAGSDHSSKYIKFCYNTGIVSAYAHSSPNAGGMTGMDSSFGSIENCYNTGDIVAFASSPSFQVSHAGGMTGRGGSAIKNCYNTGNIASIATSAILPGQSASSLAGGMASNMSDGSIENCYNTGIVFSSSNDSSSGGLVGLVGYDVTFQNCYNAGNIVALTADGVYAGAGGMTSSLSVGSIKNCYSAGDISASSAGAARAAGLAGRYINATISKNVILCGAISAQAKSADAATAEGQRSYLIGYDDANNSVKSDNPALSEIAGNAIDDTESASITLAQAKQQSTYTNLGWDFDTVWEMVPGYDFPQLKNMPAILTQTFTITATAGANGSIAPSGTVSVDEGGAQTFTITPASGYKIYDVIVDGSSVLAWLAGNSSTFSNVTADHAIAASFAPAGAGGAGSTGGGTTPAVPGEDKKDADEAPTGISNGGSGGSDAAFSDIAGHWAADAIRTVVEAGLFNGVSATNFDPDGTMTRAMFATVLSRHAGGRSAGGAAFGDVPTGRWYTDGVLWAAENGIVSGVGGGLFDPNGKITREQLAVMLYNYAKFAGIDISGSDSLSGFADGASVSSWAGGALAWAVSEGLINGKPGGLLEPKASATRAEVATILQRFLEKHA
jgi:hypothetical protein